jgi:hypothetical protein
MVNAGEPSLQLSSHATAVGIQRQASSIKHQAERTERCQAERSDKRQAEQSDKRQAEQTTIFARYAMADGPQRNCARYWQADPCLMSLAQLRHAFVYVTFCLRAPF